MTLPSEERLLLIAIASFISSGLWSLPDLDTLSEPC